MLRSVDETILGARVSCLDFIPRLVRLRGAEQGWRHGGETGSLWGPTWQWRQEVSWGTQGLCLGGGS